MPDRDCGPLLQECIRYLCDVDSASLVLQSLERTPGNRTRLPKRVSPGSPLTLRLLNLLESRRKNHPHCSEVTKEEIPSWSSWIHAYSQAIGFSVRHIQRLFNAEHDRYLERRGERRRYQRRKRQGICVKCSKEASEGIYCAFHAMEHRARSRAAYELYRKKKFARRKPSSYS